MRDQPGVVLARHFFASLFDFGFLSETGTDSLKRALLGCIAVAMGIGLLLTRVFMGKYAFLSAGPPEAYARAVVADHALLMALTMWIVAAAIGLVGHALFPDQVDYRILMAEPLSRTTVFGAKLAALVAFGALFVAGAHVALLPLILVTMIGSMKSGTFLAAAGAFAIASLLASLFAAFAVIAVHGLLVTLVPRSRLVAFSGAVRSLLIGVLVLSLPFIGRLPASAPAFASNAWWLHWAPPAWFVGLERWLIGDAARRSLGVEALAATGLVLVISVVSYVVIYRRFDRVTLTMSHAGSARPSRRWSSRHRADGRGDVRAAVREFVWITVRRSLLHQGLVVGLLAAAGGFVANSLLSARAWHVPAGQQAQHTLVATLTWAQAALMFLAAPAVRLALSVPIELRANWVFRVTEDVRTQTEAISAGVRTVLRLAVALPIALLFPLHWRVLGSSAVPLAALAALIGWLYVELVMSGWRRIPFACTYVPGKGFVPHMFVKGVAGFILFTWICGNVLHFSVVFPRAAPIFMALAGLPALALCLRRVRRPPVLGLTFEDEIPADVTPLRLSD